MTNPRNGLGESSRFSGTPPPLNRARLAVHTGCGPKVTGGPPQVTGGQGLCTFTLAGPEVPRTGLGFILAAVTVLRGVISPSLGRPPQSGGLAVPTAQELLGVTSQEVGAWYWVVSSFERQGPLRLWRQWQGLTWVRRTGWEDGVQTGH